MLFVVFSLFAAFILALSTGWTIGYYRGTYAQREKQASLAVGVSTFVLLSTVFFGQYVFTGQREENIVFGIVVMLFSISIGVVYFILKGGQPDISNNVGSVKSFFSRPLPPLPRVVFVVLL